MEPTHIYLVTYQDYDIHGTQAMLLGPPGGEGLLYNKQVEYASDEKFAPHTNEGFVTWLCLNGWTELGYEKGYTEFSLPHMWPHETWESKKILKYMKGTG